MISILKKTELFQDMNEEDIPGMLKCLGSLEKTYQKNEFIFLAGESSPMVGIILKGEAQIIKENIQGDRMILRKIKEGQIFGGIFSSMGVDIIPVSVYTTEETQVLFFNLNKIVQTCGNACPFHHQLISNMLKLFAKQNIMLNVQMSYLTHKTIRRRLEAYFYDQAELNHSYTFKLPFKKSELAEYLCVDRSAMQRELSAMQKDGIISIHKNTFKILSGK